MDLILWRHADARDGIPDITRELTEKGQRQAQRMAAWLIQQLPEQARVLASPATRSLQTAAALALEVETIDEISPGASYASVIAAAGWPHAKRPVVVVGHQPTLGHTASMLLFGTPTDFTIRKGAIVWLSNRVHGGETRAVLRVALSTEFL